MSCCCSHFQWLMRKNAQKAQRKRNFTCPTGMGVLAGERINVEVDEHGSAWQGLPAPMSRLCFQFSDPIFCFKA